MPSHRPSLLVLLALSSATALAAPPGRPDPLAAAAPVPPLVYDSAFAGYQADREPTAASWKDSNAAIGAQGGHAGHGRPHAMHDMQPNDTKPHDMKEHDMKEHDMKQHDMSTHDMSTHGAKPAPAKPADPHAEHQH